MVLQGKGRTRGVAAYLLLVFFGFSRTAVQASSKTEKCYVHSGGSLAALMDLGEGNRTKCNSIEHCKWYNESELCYAKWPHSNPKGTCFDDSNLRLGVSPAKSLTCELFEGLNCSTQFYKDLLIFKEFIIDHCPETCGHCAGSNSMFPGNDCTSHDHFDTCEEDKDCEWSFSNHTCKASSWNHSSKDEICYDNPDFQLDGKLCGAFMKAGCNAESEADLLAHNCPDSCGLCKPYVNVWSPLHGPLAEGDCRDNADFRDFYGRSCNDWAGKKCSNRDEHNVFVYPHGLISRVRDHCPATCRICPPPVSDFQCRDNPAFTDHSGLDCNSYAFMIEMNAKCVFGPQSTFSWGRFDHAHETQLVLANCAKSCQNCILPKWDSGPGNESCSDSEAYLCPDVTEDCEQEVYGFENAFDEFSRFLIWSIEFSRLYDFDTFNAMLKEAYAPSQRQVSNLKEHCPVSCRRCAVPCPPGTFSKDGTNTMTCKNCSAGMSSERNATKCFLCQPGTFSSEAGGVCASCPLGTFSADHSAVYCKQCPSGSFSGTRGQPKCDVCPAGTFSKSGASDCEPCSLGAFCVQNSTHPQPCQAGTYRISPHGKLAQDCLPCPPGFYCSDAAIPPHPCANNTYSRNAGASSIDKCTACETGCTSPSGATKCECSSSLPFVIAGSAFVFAGFLVAVALRKRNSRGGKIISSPEAG